MPVSINFHTDRSEPINVSTRNSGEFATLEIRQENDRLVMYFSPDKLPFMQMVADIMNDAFSGNPTPLSGDPK